MPITSEFVHPHVAQEEAQILLCVLRHHPGGISHMRLWNALGGARAYESGYLECLIVRLRDRKLIDWFYDDANRGSATFTLTTEGWLKAVMLERSRSSKG